MCFPPQQSRAMSDSIRKPPVLRDRYRSSVTGPSSDYGITGLVTILALAVVAGCGGADGGSRDARRTLHRVPGDIATLAEAVTMAADGDTVVLAPGTHTGGVSLAGKSLTIASEALLSGDTSVVGATILDGQDGDYVLFLPETEAVAEIHGLTLRNADDCIYPNAHFRLIHSVIRECTDGVDYELGSGGLISKSVFENNRDDGVDLDEDVAVVIENSVIRFNDGDGIEIRLMPWDGEVREVVIRGNHIHDNRSDGIQFIDYDGYSNRSYLVEENRIQNNGQAGIGCMDNAETDEDYRAADIPEPVHLTNNEISGNDRNLSCGTLGSGQNTNPSG